MKVAITGSHGLIGSALIRRLTADGHDVLRVTRDDSGHLDTSAIHGVDAVVHLGGVGIADKRWSNSHKRRVLDSRVEGTTAVARAVAESDPPPTLLSASAIGYYGDCGSEDITEDRGPGTGYLADVCVAWEKATEAAENSGARVVHLRSGVVLTPEGGALKKQLPLFKAGLGGKLGSGRQWFSWITLEDEINAILFALREPRIDGAINLTAPHPVTNAEFTEALGHALHRPTVLSVPSAALKVALGAEMAAEMLLAGAKVLPRALERAGFAFAHPSLEEALHALLG